MTRPTVSVIMSAYNHADFVQQTVESVLSQQGVELEFLIGDDGSPDRTREVVASIKDERIRLFANEKNRGAALVTDELIGRAAGEFIAILNSDDYWPCPDKLAYQLQVMRERPEVGACFGRARFVDKDGCAIDKATMQYGSVFDKENRSQAQWLRHFFYSGNCLCHPTLLIRKACYDAVGTYSNQLRQVPDFDMWIRLLKKYEIFVSDRELVAFRQLPGQNASGPSTDNMRRIRNEMYLVFRSFFDQMPDDLLRDGFSDMFVDKNASKPEELEIEKAFLYLTEDRWLARIYNPIGLEKVYWLLNHEPYREILSRNYAFDDLAFHALQAKVATFDPPTPAPKPRPSAAPGVSLSAASGTLLLAEVLKRCKARLPKWVRSTARKLKRRPKVTMPSS